MRMANEEDGRIFTSIQDAQVGSSNSCNAGNITAATAAAAGARAAATKSSISSSIDSKPLQLQHSNNFHEMKTF